MTTRLAQLNASVKMYFIEGLRFTDESRFIYDIRGDRNITVVGEDTPRNESNRTAGIYLYDLSTGSHTLLVEGGQNGVVSPVANQVAYIKGKQIWIYDLTKNAKRAVYTPGEREKVMHIHWTPNGEHIYLTNYNEFALGFFENDEKLIRADNGKEVPFKKLGHGFGSYTWK